MTWQKKFHLFLIGQNVTSLGTQVVQYVTIWYITIATQSGMMMMYSTIASFLPGIIISPYAGVISDRLNRKYIVIITDIAIALVTTLMAILFVFRGPSYPLVFVLLAIRSLGSGIQEPASLALFPQLVPEANITQANGISASIRNVTSLIAPVLGGLLFATFGFTAALFVDLITALIGSAIILSLKIERHENTLPQVSVYEDFKTGLGYIRTDPVLPKLLLFYVLFFFFVAPMVFLTPILVARSFGSEVWRLTAFEMIFTLGALAGGLIVVKIHSTYKNLSVVAFSAISFSVFSTLMGLVNYYWLFVSISFLAGISVSLFHAPATSFLQTYVPQDKLGRVMSVESMLLSSTMPIGMIVFGPLADIVSVEKILVVTGIIMLLISINFKRNKAFKAF